MDVVIYNKHEKLCLYLIIASVKSADFYSCKTAGSQSMLILEFCFTSVVIMIIITIVFNSCDSGCFIILVSYLNTIVLYIYRKSRNYFIVYCIIVRHSSLIQPSQIVATTDTEN